MIDKNLVNFHIKELEKYYIILKSLKHYTLEDLNDPRTAWAVEHGLQLSIQSVLDIGNHILAGLGISDIEDYMDVIIKLGEQGVISTEFADEISGMAGFRNLMVHEYVKVSLKKVHEMLTEHTEDFKTFAEQVAKYLEEKN